jgi:hypothetical protein
VLFCPNLVTPAAVARDAEKLNAMSRFAFQLCDWFSDNAAQVDRHLKRYFDGQAGDQFTGRWFEEFAAMGDAHRFETSDVLAAEALSVSVPPEAAAKLLVTESERFNSLLRRIPREQDLWEVRRLAVDVGSPADDLHAALRQLPGVDWVTAGKLIAAKRPRLIPILDNRVNDFLKPRKGLFWVSLYDELSDGACRATIAQACSAAPPYVSLLRRIDVAIWMAATQ